MLNYANIKTDDLYRLALEAKVHSRTVRRWLRGEKVQRVTAGALAAAAKKLKLEVELGAAKAAEAG